MKIIFTLLYVLFSFASLALADEPHLVYLAAKSKLISISTQKELINEKPKMVYALEENPNDRKQYWIYNNKKEKKYLTSAFNITEIESDYNLMPQMEKTKVYQSSQDTMMPFESTFNVHLEQVSMSDFNTLYTAQTNAATATRYELRTVYHTPLPIHFGVNLNFQNVYWNNGNEKIRLSILSLGPSFSYKLLSSDFFSLSLLGDAEISPIAQSTSSLNTENFNAFSFGTGLEGEVSNRYGIFTIGTNLRQYLLVLQNTSRTNIAPSASEYKLTSIGISLGYKVEWEL